MSSPKNGVTPPRDAGRPSQGRRFLLTTMRRPEIGAFFALVVLSVFFSIFAENFASLPNVAAIFTTVSEVGIVAIGVTFLMISGEFDLSVGSVYALTAIIFGLCLNAHIPLLISLLIAIVGGAITGFINGIITVKSRIPSFIVTLGTMMWWRGVVLYLTKGDMYLRYNGNPDYLRALNHRFGLSLIGDFRTSLIWFLCLLVVFHVLLNNTKYGNSVFAVGGSRDAATAMGLNTGRIKIANFVLVGILTAVAGALSFSRFQTIDPQTGQGMELNVIAACVIGGTLLTGGYGSVFGSLIGMLIVGMLSSALILLGVSAYYYQAFIGVILVIAAILNSKIMTVEQRL
jgi:simple sugar transport system permease protein